VIGRAGLLTVWACLWFWSGSTCDLAVGTHDVSLGCWEVRELWADGHGLAQLQLSSGCTARGGMRRASRAPPKSLQDPEWSCRDAVPSGALTSGAFFYSFRHRLPMATVVWNAEPPQCFWVLSLSVSAAAPKLQGACRAGCRVDGSHERVQSATGCGKNMVTG